MSLRITCPGCHASYPVDDDLRGKKVAIGPEGSGTRHIAERFLGLNGITEDQLQLLPLTGGEAADALLKGEIDAATMAATWDTEAVRRLVASSEVNLFGSPRADAYVALYPYLTKLVVPQGVGNLGANRPATDVNLVATKASLIVRKYVHMGFAADTPNGLVVPVVRDADRKDVYELARHLGQLSEKARAGKLPPTDMQGGCFTISSLGGIGGTAFTPIINAPEVAILGVSRAAMRPVYRDLSFVPRLMLPLSLSYDHRVIDGAMAARFTTWLAQVLADPRSLLEAVP